MRSTMKRCDQQTERSEKTCEQRRKKERRKPSKAQMIHGQTDVDGWLCNLNGMRRKRIDRPAEVWKNKWQQTGRQQCLMMVSTWYGKTRIEIYLSVCVCVLRKKTDDTKQSGCAKIRCTTKKHWQDRIPMDGLWDWLYWYWSTIDGLAGEWTLPQTDMCVCVCTVCNDLETSNLWVFFQMLLTSPSAKVPDLISKALIDGDTMPSGQHIGVGLVWWKIKLFHHIPSPMPNSAPTTELTFVRLSKRYRKHSRQNPATTCSVHDIVSTWLRYSSKCIQETQQQVRQTETCLRSKISLVKGYPSISSPLQAQCSVLNWSNYV